MNTLDVILKEYGFTEDTSGISTVVLGGPRMRDALGPLTAAYNPTQARDPKGTKTGGRWTKQAAAVPTFGTRQEAEEWFREFGIEDVNLAGIESLPDGMKIAQGAAQALAHEASLHPGILGEYGLKAIVTSNDSRMLAAQLTHGYNFDDSGSWAVTMPYSDLLDPLSIYEGNSPYQSAIVLSMSGISDDLAIPRMAANGMAPQTYEQAFAHELGHVHENSIGWGQSMNTYLQAVANTEEAMAAEAGIEGYTSDLVDGDGYMSDPVAAVLDYGISPYAQASPREAFAEHFVRRTYADSYEAARIRDWDAVVWADRIADEYNRLQGAKHL